MLVIQSSAPAGRFGEGLTGASLREVLGVPRLHTIARAGGSPIPSGQGFNSDRDNGYYSRRYAYRSAFHELRPGVSARMQAGRRGHRLQAVGIALPVWAFSRLVEVQEPRRARGEAGGGGGVAVINKQGQKVGPKRGSRQRFPYEPRVVGGRLLMPAELQAIHRYVTEKPVLEAVTEEIRAVVENVWPELISSFRRGLEMPSRGGG